MTERKLVYDALCKTQRDGSYSNLIWDAMVQSEQLDQRAVAFASRLFYGVLERKLTLEYQIQSLTGKPLQKLDLEVIVALEMGLYQLTYMDSVPASAAVNESVNLIKKSKKRSAAGFVNGVLRNYIRQGSRISLPTPENSHERAAVEYSIPLWILRYWERDYGWEAALGLAKACLDRPPLSIRVNTQKTTAAAVTQLLSQAGVAVTPHPLVENCLMIAQSGSVSGLPGFAQGLFYVQDTSSQLCAAALGAQPGDRVFDLCAAPGSKSFTIAQMMADQGEICAFDLYEHRVGLITEGAKRLGLTVIHAMPGDASRFDSGLGEADRVLCDVPCSGLGIVRRKPEIKYKRQEEVDALPPIQLAILTNGARYVKRGGVLVYSTCSLNQDENERVVDAFLQEHPDFQRDPLPPVFESLTESEASQVTLTPLSGNFDGFFLSRLKRR